MFYIILLSILLLASILVIRYKKYDNKIFLSALFFLLIIGILRYGSGTDYFSYKYHFNIIPSNLIDSIFNVSGTDSEHLEIGFRLLMSISKLLDMNYEFFIGLLSILTTSIIGYVIYINSNLKTLSLLIFFSNYFLVYANSALRQGLAMCLFLFAYYQFYRHKKYIKYIATICIAITMHDSAVICLIVFAIELIFKLNLNIKRNHIILIISTILFNLFNIPAIIMELLNLAFDYEIGDINWAPLLVRIFYALIVFCFIQLNEDYNRVLFNKKQIYLFFITILIYIAFSRFSIISRITDYLTMLEIIIIPNLIYHSCQKKFIEGLNIGKQSIKLPIIKFQWISIYLLLIILLFIKDISAFTYQEKYFKKNILGYQYVTIFNKEKLYTLREIDPKFAE